MALKAGKVANPPPGLEGEIYRQLKMTRAAPQGICVMNSSGQALAWTLMFENDAEVLNFLDYGLARFSQFPNRSTDFETERFHRFPRAKMPDVSADGPVLKRPLGHAPGESCPGDLPIQSGAIPVRIVGRAFHGDGKPLSEVRSQDHYIEDRFEIARSLQKSFLAAIPAEGGRFSLPAELGRVLVKNAHLGQLDIQPLDSGAALTAKNTKTEIDLWAEVDPENFSLLRIGGVSSVAGHDAQPGRAIWESEVTLNWKGFITLEAKSISELVLAACGVERLRWGNSSLPTGNAVANLPGGSPIDFEGPVKYGILGSRRD